MKHRYTYTEGLERIFFFLECINFSEKCGIWLLKIIAFFAQYLGKREGSFPYFLSIPYSKFLYTQVYQESDYQMYYLPVYLGDLVGVHLWNTNWAQTGLNWPHLFLILTLLQFSISLNMSLILPQETLSVYKSVY